LGFPPGLAGVCVKRRARGWGQRLAGRYDGQPEILAAAACAGDRGAAEGRGEVVRAGGVTTDRAGGEDLDRAYGAADHVPLQPPAANFTLGGFRPASSRWRWGVCARSVLAEVPVLERALAVADGGPGSFGRLLFRLLLGAPLAHAVDATADPHHGTEG